MVKDQGLHLSFFLSGDAHRRVHPTIPGLPMLAPARPTSGTFRTIQALSMGWGLLYPCIHRSYSLPPSQGCLPLRMISGMSQGQGPLGQ